MINLNKGQYIVALEDSYMSVDDDEQGEQCFTKNKIYKFIKNCTIIDDEDIEHGIVDDTFATAHFRQATQKEIDDYLKGKLFVDDVELEEVVIISNVSHLDLVSKIFDWVRNKNRGIVIIKEIKFFEKTHEDEYQAKIIYKIIK